MPFFSVVMPLYNKRDYLLRAVDSVLAQDLRDLELLVVDDGSTDGGGDLLRRERRDRRLRVLRQANAGVSAARNRGIRAARARLVAFLDADDEWLPGFLSSVKGLVRRFPRAGSYGTDSFLQRRWKRLRWRHPDIPEGFEGILRDYFRLILKRYPIHTSAFVARKALFRKAGYFQLGMRNGQDLDMWFRLAREAPVAFLNRPLTVYHRDVANSAVDRPDRDYRAAFRTIRLTLRDPRLAPSDREAVREYGNLVALKAARALLGQGRRPEARALLAGMGTRRFERRRRLLAVLAGLPFNPFPLYRRLRKLV